jgi:sigma-B regulation protein RsbU (phosphoserine phosphatase)
MATIYIYPKQGEAASVVLKNAPMTLGRLAENDIPLPDPFCSSRHAVIFPSDAGGFSIRDNGSKNGTFVNGKKLAEPADLKEGDEILIGSVRILFNRAIQTSVEVTDGPAPTTNVNTVIPFRDILARPSARTTVQAVLPVNEVDEIRAENKLFGVLSEVSRALVLHKPLAELLDHVMDLISSHLSMDRGVLMLREGNPVQLIPKVVRINAKHLQGQKIQVSRSIMAMAFDEQLAVLTSDASVDPRFKGRESIIDSGIHSAMCVPLWNNREIIGIIYADRISLLQEFSEEDLRLLTLLANLAAIKIENAALIEQSIEKERMERELQLAVQIQKDFLPKSIPKSGPFDIVGRNLPCRQVGGDYYDFIPVEPGRLGVTVADVSGKGVSASLLMASLRAALHSEIQPRARIDHMAVKLNDFVQKSSAINAFITFFYGDLDTEAGGFAYVNAGHNHPFILGVRGKPRFLESTGLCLGMLPGTTYERRADTLAPGETLVLFTDGIVESRNAAGEEYGAERLVDVSRRAAGGCAADILESVFRDLDAFTAKAPAADDRTLVIVKRAG